MLAILEFWIWAASAVLIVMYGAVGFMKMFRPISQLANMLAWPGDVPPAMVRSIGMAEILGVLGLSLPVLTGIAVWLTPLAALGLALIQVIAIPFHARRGETSQTLPINLFLLALTSFVAWARWPLL